MRCVSAQREQRKPISRKRAKHYINLCHRVLRKHTLSTATNGVPVCPGKVLRSERILTPTRSFISSGTAKTNRASGTEELSIRHLRFQRRETEKQPPQVTTNARNIQNGAPNNVQDLAGSRFAMLINEALPGSKSGPKSTSSVSCLIRNSGKLSLRISRYKTTTKATRTLWKLCVFVVRVLPCRAAPLSWPWRACPRNNSAMHCNQT